MAAKTYPKTIRVPVTVDEFKAVRLHAASKRKPVSVLGREMMLSELSRIVAAPVRAEEPDPFTGEASN